MSSLTEQQFCLRWHNFQASLLSSLPQMLDGDDLTDVTLSAGGASVRAHRVVLSACSAYFKELFKRLPSAQHPVIVLPGARFSELRALVTFMYSGEVNVYQAQLPGLLHMADALQVRGLAQVGPSQDAPPDAAPTKKRPRYADAVDAGEPLGPRETASGKRPAPNANVAPTTNPLPTAPLTTAPNLTTAPATALPKKELAESTSEVEQAVNVPPAPPVSEDALASAATCPVCGKRLSNPYNLRVHLDTHARAAHACSACPHVSRSRDALRKHVSYRHPAAAAGLEHAARRGKDVNNNAGGQGGRGPAE